MKKGAETYPPDHSSEQISPSRRGKPFDVGFGKKIWGSDIMKEVFATHSIGGKTEKIKY